MDPKELIIEDKNHKWNINKQFKSRRKQKLLNKQLKMKKKRINV